jgi:hypothetical protein
VLRKKTANESAFDQCVRAAGGVCLDDTIDYDAGVRKADYFFESDNVIAELKRLAKDPLAEAVKEKLQRLYDSWVRDGLLPPSRTAGKVTLNMRTLPRNCAIEALGVLKKQFDDAYVRGANDQIKSTKKLLGRPNAKGLLLLMNECNYSHEPPVIFNLLFHIFNGKARSCINQVAVFTVDFASTLPHGRTGFYWAQPSIPSREDVPTALTKRLHQHWATLIRSKHPNVSEPLISIQGPTIEMMEQVKHLRSGE